MLLRKTNTQKLLLLGCITVVFLLLRHKYHLSALETDEGSYAYMAQEILRGKLPYVDYFDHKPPVIYLIYALVIKLFGFNTIAIKVSATVAGLISGLFVYTIAQKIFDTRYAILAYALFLFSLTLPFIQTSTANTEIFMIVFILAGTYILLNQSTLRWTFIAGMLFGIAVLAKTIAITNFAAVLLFLIVLKEYHRIGAVILGCSIILVFPIVYYFSLGGMEYAADYWFANIAYNSLYLNQPTFVERFYRFPLEIIGENGLLWILGISGVFFAIRRLRYGIKLVNLFISANIIFSLLFIQYIGRASPHYYIQLVPFLVFSTIYFTQEALQRHTAKILLFLLVLTSIGFSIFTYYNKVYTVSTPQLLAHIFIHEDRAVLWDQIDDLSKHISETVQPSEYIYNIGRESQIYAYTQTRSSSKYYYDRPLWVGADGVFDEICQDFKTTPPRVVVDTLQPPLFPEPIFKHFAIQLFACSGLQIEKTEQVEYAKIHFIATD